MDRGGRPPFRAGEELYPGDVRIIASPKAVDFVRERGGRLFVWIERLTC